MSHAVPAFHPLTTGRIFDQAIAIYRLIFPHRTTSPRHRTALRLVAILACLAILSRAAWTASASGHHDRQLASPPAGPIPLSEYWERLRRTRQTLEDLAAAQAPAALQATADPQAVPGLRDAMDALAREWSDVTAVQAPGADPAPIDNTPLITALRRDPPDPRRAIQVIDQLLAYEKNWSKSTFSTRDLARLRPILERAEFQWPPAQPNRLQELWQRLVDALRRLLDRLFGSPTLQAGASYSRYLWIALGALSALLVLLLASRGLWRSLVRDEALAAHDAAFDQVTADGALRRAQELSSAGDYRQGVRYLYLSALLLLEEHGLLRYDRSRTNREVLRSVAHRPELSAPLQRVVEVFDRVWYGYQPIGQEEFDAYTADVDQLRRQK